MRLFSYGAVGLAALICGLLWSEQAAAQYICPGGPGPGERQVGTTNQGQGAAPLPLCVSDSSASSQPTASSSDYMALAWHAHASDVWVSARYQNRATAERIALKYCNEAMGSGCEAVWQADGYIVAGLGESGNIHWATSSSKSDALNMLKNDCKIYILGCIPIGAFKATDTYESDGESINIRKPKNMATVRKKYGAVAWPIGTAYDGVAFFSGGHADWAEASEGAMLACRAQYQAKGECKVETGTGNGVVLGYKVLKPGNPRLEFGYLAAQTSQRARDTLATWCKREKFNCTPIREFDVRQAGLTMHRLD